MKRRAFLTASATAAAASSFPAPAIAQGIRELKLVSSFPLRGRTELPNQTITEASGGRLKVKIFAPGELVGGFEVFDAVSEGVADMYWSAEYYWHKRSPAFSFFGAAPFGLTPSETYAWIYRGGGQELWDELSAEFNLKPFLAGSSGFQMGGWYAKEMTAAEDFKGLRIRIPGLGGEVMRRLGAIVVDLPGNEIVPALKSGALDAAEWVGPWQDYVVGLHTAATYYYYPGFQEPGTSLSVGVNKTLWESLSTEEKSLIEIALAGYHTYYQADLLVRHMKHLPILLEEHDVQLRKYNEEILLALGKASGEVAAELGASDPLTRRIYESYTMFRKASRGWTDISERAYLNARALDFPYGN
jgi:TRAP-type mannitol/chloroaromatic compound transport system substrate-binding protein